MATPRLYICIQPDCTHPAAPRPLQVKEGALQISPRYLMLGLTKHGPRRADAGTPSGSLLCVCAGVIARRDGCQTGVGFPPPAGFVVTSVDRYNVTLIL